MPQFAGLSAILLNCSLGHDAKKSHTRRLLARVAGIMQTEGVAVELIHVLDHQVGFGMVPDTTEIGDDRDDWPDIHAKIMDADILAKVSRNLGQPMTGIGMDDTIKFAERGW